MSRDNTKRSSGEIRRDPGQILEAIRTPAVRGEKRCEPKRGGTQQVESQSLETGWPTTNQFGSHIEDLFSHSYTPPLPPTLPPRWLWIEAARVWNPSAATHPTRASEVKRFGGQAKQLCKVTPSSIDSRSFVEVVKSKKMDRRFQQFRDGRDSRDMNRGGRYMNRDRRGAGEFQGTRG